MRFSTPLRLLVSLSFCVSVSAIAQTLPTSTTFTEPIDTLQRQLDEVRSRMIDPQLGTVPYERLDKARQQLTIDKQQSGASFGQLGIPNITWQERGPTNFADVRAVLVDPNDPAKKKVWVGTAAGGLWYTTDITSSTPSWVYVSDGWESQLVSTLVADPSNPQIMYAGTGDLNNTVGRGIWKTTNGGATWTRLNSTIPGGNYPSVSRGFEYIQRLAVTSNGQLFGACRFGVVRSVDGGATWQTVLAPNQGIGFGSSPGNYSNDLVYDLEIASDGVVYAGFSLGRMFKSTNAGATSWAEITPSGTTGERTELAVAPSTSGAGQVLYAVSRLSNNTVYNQDIKWFKRSTDAGITWTDVPIPMVGNDHFTQGYGYRYMSLTAHPTDPSIVFAGGAWLFRSINGGATWTNVLEASTGNALYNQIALQVIPGTDGVVNVSRQGIYWLADGASTTVATPTAVARTTGIRTAAAYTLAMKNSPGSNYFLTNVQPNGFIIMNAPGIGQANTTIWGTSSTNNAHIDTNEPTVQVFLGYNAVNVFNGSTYQTIYSVGSNGLISSEYDSQANTLYVYDYITNAPVIRRTTGIGSGTLTTTTIPLTPLAAQEDRLTYMKLNAAGTALFVGSYSGKVYKITGLNQASPTLTRIDNGAFGQVAVSCIDVGATDNELLVTFSNYGSQSIWYTVDGGDYWAAKDQLNYGLPDIPVWTAMFNPQNRQQVLLGTELGVWTTANITANNPGWTVSDGGLPLLRVYQLRYRPADGKLAAATVGRGIWTSDAFAIPYTLPTVTLTGVDNRTLCAGGTMAVSFGTSGTFEATNQFEVWISDATGSFATQRRIGLGTSSPVSVTLPGGYDALPYGTGYVVKVVAVSPEVESSSSAPLTIGTLSSATVYDRVGNTGSAQICTGSQATFSIRSRDYYGANIAAERYQWLKDGAPINGATNATYTATQTGVYSASVGQAGCVKTTSAYTLNVSNSLNAYISTSDYSNNQCTGGVVSLSAIYPGDIVSYQWIKDNVNVSGATSAVYGATQSGQYSLFIRDQSCSSTVGTLRFQFSSSIEATIYHNSIADSLICSGYTTQTYMYLANSQRFSSVKWYKNGVVIPGATSTSYYAPGPGAYSVQVQQGACQTASNTLTRSYAQQIPVRIQYGGNTMLCSGESRTLYAQSASGSSYRWQRNGADIPGATSSQYTVSNSGVYTVRDSIGRICNAVSDAVSFTFSNAIQPRIVSNSGDPNTTEFCYGDYIYNYESRYGGNVLQGYTYQWQRDGADIAGAQSSSQYAGSSGLYTLRVTNGSCTGLSKGIYIRTGSTAKPVISANNTNQDRCANNITSLYAYVSNGVYQWKRNGAALSGATFSTYYATQSGLYSVATTYGNCTAESDPVLIKIGEPTAATLTGGALVNAGQTAYLPITFSGPAPWSVTLSNGQSATSIMQNPYLMPVAPINTTTYSIATVANACATGTSLGNAVVTVGTGNADLSLNMIVSNRVPKMYDIVSYSLVLTNAGPEAATGVQIQSTLPQYVSFLDSQSPGITHSSGVVAVAGGTIPVGIPTVFVFRTIISSPGTLVTSAQITSVQTPDPDSQPNSGTGDGQDDQAQVDLRTADQSGPLVASANPNQVPLPPVSSNQPVPSSSAVELSLQMSLNKSLVSVSQQDVVTATLTVRNRSSIPATGVAVRVLLPNGALVPSSQTGWQVINAQTINGYVNAIPAGGLATLQLTWRPTAEGELKAQIADVIEQVIGFIPGNGYTQGEKDEAQVRIRVR